MHRDAASLMVPDVLAVGARLAGAILRSGAEEVILVPEPGPVPRLVEGDQQKDVTVAVDVADVPDGGRELHAEERGDLLA